MGRLRYSILGPLEVRDGRGEIALLRGGQQRKLLAILLLHGGEAVSSDRLIDELWDGKPPDTAAKALQGYVSSLRKQLGHDAIETVGAGYRLEIAAEDVDASRFEELLAEARPLDREPATVKLREALALWRGPALADFAYDDFARHEIDRLEELHLGALERRIHLELALGHHDDLVPELEALVRAHPLHEHLRGHLMVALYRSGRQAEALDAYRDGRNALRDELGLEPSEELQALQRAILAHDESLVAPPRVDPPRPTRAGRPTEGRRLRRPLVAAAVGLAILGGAAAAIVLLTRGAPAAVVVPKDSVALIDRAGTEVDDYYQVGRGPVAVAVGSGGARGVWVANALDESIARLAPASGKLVNIFIGADVNDIAVGFRSVWVADGNSGTVTRIDPTLDQVVETIKPPGKQTIAPDPVFFVAVGSGYVWATRGDELLRIDPVTDRAVPVRKVGAPTGLTTGGGSVWVTNGSERLLRIDPRTGNQTGSYAFADSVIAPVYTRGSLWLIYGGKIQQVDPTTVEPGDTMSVAAGRATSLTAGNGALWALGSEGALTQFSLDGGTRSSLQVDGSGLSAVAAGAGATWVAVSAPG